MYLPSNLRDFQIELAGKLATLETPGPEVKSLRERYGFTQDWLAGLLGIRRESLSRIESDHVSLSLNFIQRFTKIMTLARGVREHMAFVEARDNPPDEAFLAMLAVGIRLEKEVADEVILASQINYEQKRKSALRGLTREGDASRGGSVIPSGIRPGSISSVSTGEARRAPGSGGGIS